ncbi:hypothetical protein AA11825_0326 [Acetobacter pomorum DSM 11825]|nr:hypothetical protein AA11825_0326 [Acetobacter pomorum DSM 11825]
MQQRGCVNELYTCSNFHMPHAPILIVVAAHSGRSQREQGPQPLTTRRNQMGRKLRYKRHGALHTVYNDLIAGKHVRRKIIGQRFQACFSWFTH